MAYYNNNSSFSGPPGADVRGQKRVIQLPHQIKNRYVRENFESLKQELEEVLRRISPYINDRGYLQAPVLLADLEELTDPLTHITHTAPGTADYAIQDLTNSSPYGFVTKDEGNTLLSVVKNLQERLDELESRLQEWGILD